jgi:hypothetical protein
MRRGFVILVSLLVGCGSDDDSDQVADEGCASVVVGTWAGATVDDSITISANRSFRYSGVDACTSNGSFTCPSSNVMSGTMPVNIATSSGGTCLPAGDYVCAFTLTGDSMAYDCTGSGALQYTRQ